MNLMNLELSTEQYKTLLLSVCYATECLDDSEANSMGEKILALFDTLQAMAPSAGLQIGKELSKDEDGKIELHPDFVNNTEDFVELYEDHREDVFWSELLARMAGKQLHRKFGKNFDPKKASQKEQDKIWEKIEIELAEHGLDNLVFKGE